MPKPLRKSKLKAACASRRHASHPISDTYDQILAVAEQEFANSGYNGTSLEVIARRTGIRKASLFHHFNSKRKIFDAVVRRIFDQLVLDRARDRRNREPEGAPARDHRSPARFHREPSESRAPIDASRA